MDARIQRIDEKRVHFDRREKSLFVSDFRQTASVEISCSTRNETGISFLQMNHPLKRRFILGMRVDATSYADATARVLKWAKTGKSYYVCVSNVHSVMESYDAREFKKLVNGADLVTPDGMPLVWALKLTGIPDATRVYGPDLTLCVCEEAAKAGIPIGLYGGTSESIQDFVNFLERRFPGIRVVCRIAPPFRPLTPEEDEAYTRQIVASGARILFVGIGCPKQEKWMAAHRGRIPAVMLGVGAAFDFYSGKVKQSPAWLQRIGMEWFFRLLMEPRRLWKRYTKNNPRFVALFLMQMLGLRQFSG
jgi:N-acetylglucosaminyldiphosphoundecaprenol N-acetyl-beta-D-mannosaminyltransferase